MEIFRLSKSAYADIDGAGGLIFSGRWHMAGNLVVYASQYRSLAVLESLVHLSKSNLLVIDFVLSTLFIPDEIIIEVLDLKKLSKDWNSLKKIDRTQDLGTNFLKSANHAILKVPSAIIADEYNYIINPAHKDSVNIRIVSKQAFSFDGRLKG